MVDDVVFVKEEEKCVSNYSDRSISSNSDRSMCSYSCSGVGFLLWWLSVVVQ